MTAVAAPTLPPSLRSLGRHRGPARAPRLAVAAAMLAGAATFTLVATGGVTTLPTETTVRDALTQTVTTGLTGIRDLPVLGRSQR